jgi:hypothetical protein
MSSYTPVNKAVLRRPLEPKLDARVAVEHRARCHVPVGDCHGEASVTSEVRM